MIAAFVLLALAIGWRLLGIGHRHDFDWIHNFAPLSAIALCGAFVLPRRLAFALPLLALLATDLILNSYYGASLFSVEMAARYGVLGVVAGAGWWLRRHPQAAVVLGTSALCSVLFYFITNSASWLTLTNPGYAKTFEGWAQAMTGGLPGYPPTLVFFRNTLVSDIAFTALFLLCLRLSRPSETTEPSRQPEMARWV